MASKISHQGPDYLLPQSKSSVQTSYQVITKVLAVFFCMLGRQAPTCIPKAPPGNIRGEDCKLPLKGQKSLSLCFDQIQIWQKFKKMILKMLKIARISLRSILNTEITRSEMELMYTFKRAVKWFLKGIFSFQTPEKK